MLSRLAATLTDDTVSAIKEDRASEGRERGTKQIERAWCLVGNARIQTLFELVVHTGDRHW